mgnify:CR=1 FL=1
MESIKRIPFKKLIMKILNILRHFFSNRGFSFSAILCLALIVLITQCVLEYGPSWKESNRISKQISLFKDYWEKEGAQKFQSVGLAPTEELYQEPSRCWRYFGCNGYVHWYAGCCYCCFCYIPDLL